MPQSNTSLPTASPGHPSTLSKHRRSNSLSTSSVVTVKRTSSFSSSQGGGSRSTSSYARSQSPGENTLLSGRTPKDYVTQYTNRRASVAHERSESESSGVRDGVGNLNRWSQSTTSSVSSTGNVRRNRASSGAALAQNQVSTAPPARAYTRLNETHAGSPQRRASPRASPQRQRPSESKSPERQRRRQPSQDPISPANGLSGLRLPSLTHIATVDTVSPSTLQSTTPSTAGLLTPASYYSHASSDYFGSVSPSDGTEKSGEQVIDRALPGQSPAGRSRYSKQVQPDQYGGATANDTPERNGDDPESSRAGHKRSRTRERKERDKKTMLSKALEKANTAVLLDNALNYEGALDAYWDACNLLQTVMERTSGVEDKRKLDAIRDTYTSRIEELYQLQAAQAAPPAEDGKELPPRPMSDGSDELSPPLPSSDWGGNDAASIQTATMTRVRDLPSISSKTRDSFLTTAIKEVEGRSSGSFLGPLWERSKSPFEGSYVSDRTARAGDDMDSAYMPPPLTPVRGTTPVGQPSEATQDVEEGIAQTASSDQQNENETSDPVSWLDTIDESESSCDSSSMHSVSADRGMYRKDLRAVSREAHPDFDAAFDAAVEAAYEDGFEPDEEYMQQVDGSTNYRISDQTQQSRLDMGVTPTPDQINGDIDTDAEEEQLLDDLTKDYIGHGFNFDLQSKSALPRTSDSSGYSRSTWQSSFDSSHRTTAGTSLTTVAEDSLANQLSSRVQSKRQSSFGFNGLEMASAPGPPPANPLPRPPNVLADQNGDNRRRSGPNFRGLKIETSGKPLEHSKRVSSLQHAMTPTEAVSPSTHLAPSSTESPTAADKRISEVPSLRKITPNINYPYTLHSASSDSSTLPTSLDSAYPPDSAYSRTSPRPGLWKRNKSSLSLRHASGSMISSPDTHDGPLATPLSSTFMLGPRASDAPRTAYRVASAGTGLVFEGGQQGQGGSYLFDTSLHVSAPTSPTSPGFYQGPESPPAPLEPCPESVLLRPFWLLRCVGNTLTHPRSGFLTQRLFVPREAWMVRGVKLKNVEDKVANLDLLTAALGRLQKVDTFDADAVLEELQGFEEVMERVQQGLQKRLGSEVGVQGIGNLFQHANATEGGVGGDKGDGGAQKSGSKSGWSSWRKLRSKNSNIGLVNHAGARRDADKDAPTMTSVPMTSFLSVSSRHHGRRDVRDVSFEGPQREYMASLARLCEGIVALDQIARQVEDPGLKHSSPTHVGLELSVRHASEFFGFYVCRFVLADVGTLVDKYVKRGTEWVLS